MIKRQNFEKINNAIAFSQNFINYRKKISEAKACVNSTNIIREIKNNNFIVQQSRYKKVIRQLRQNST
jgi:hypothetical protein